MNLKRSNEKRKEYRRLYSDKESFLSLIQNFTNISIAKELTLKDIELEESFICEYKGKEVDIVYKVFSKNRKVTNYIVLEFQTEMDTDIVLRIKSYREQIWKNFIIKKSLEEIENEDFKLPKVIPIVLYNGPERLNRKQGILDIIESISENNNNSSVRN